MEVLTERASVCPIADKRDWLFNVWTMCSTLTQLAPYLDRPRSDVDVVICDRGIFDALCWFQWLVNNGHLDNVTHGHLSGFLCLPRFRAALDLVYVFTSTAERSIEREYAYLLTRQQGSIMNDDVLRSYYDAIAETMTTYRPRFRKVEHIDTTDLDQNHVGSQVTEKVLEVLRDAAEERIGYVPKEELQLPPGGAVACRWSELLRNPSSPPELKFG
ncbi:MAG TPA: hypothetical protein VNG04_09570, partial [Candidatus Acidoferrum sp.]|nr:hypothetical protein [Candidatus Acidoferrum sp.]